MASILISGNPGIYNHEQSFNKFGYIDWKKNSYKYRLNDTVYIYVSLPKGKYKNNYKGLSKRIKYKCKVIKLDLNFNEIRDDREYWYDPTKYEEGKKDTYVRLQLLEKIDTRYLDYQILLEKGLKGRIQGKVDLDNNVTLLEYIEEIFRKYNKDELETDDFVDVYKEDIKQTNIEGGKKIINVVKYERSSKARQKCLKYHGLICQICGFDFKEKYGEIGEGYIHVHHINPIYTQKGKEYKIDYKKDLIPVCPNCHAMLHKKSIKGVNLSIEELRKIINDKKYR